MQGTPLMKPKIEADLQPQMFSQVFSNPQQAADVREIMSTVTEEAGGTGGRESVSKYASAGTGIMAYRGQNRDGGKG